MTTPDPVEAPAAKGERFVVLDLNEAVVRGWCEAWEAGECRSGLFDAATEPPTLVGTDYGEPEDNSFHRDWRWVSKLLNALAAQVATLTAERDAAVRVLAAVPDYFGGWCQTAEGPGDDDGCPTPVKAPVTGCACLVCAAERLLPPVPAKAAPAFVPHEGCKVSMGIHNGLTFGSGRLDDHGYWEIPCADCARAYEAANPQDYPCWPFAPARPNEVEG